MSVWCSAGSVQLVYGAFSLKTTLWELWAWTKTVASWWTVKQWAETHFKRASKEFLLSSYTLLDCISIYMLWICIESVLVYCFFQKLTQLSIILFVLQPCWSMWHHATHSSVINSVPSIGMQCTVALKKSECWTYSSGDQKHGCERCMQD